MKSIIPLLISILFFADAHSQNRSVIDSLRANVEMSEGLAKAQALNKLAFKYAFNNFDSALCTIEKSIQLTTQNHYDSLNTEAYNIKGVIYDVKGITDSSEFYFLKTYNLSIERGIATYTRFSTNNLGMMYWRRGDFNKAIDYFFKALKMAEELNNRKFATIALSNIGLIYQQMQQFDKALEYHKRALALRKEFNTINDMPASYNNIGICYKGLNQYDSAIYFYNKAIEYAKKTSNSMEEGMALDNLGNVYFLLNDYQKSEYYYLKALKSEGIDSKSGMLTHTYLTAVYYALGDYTKGLNYGLKAKKTIEENENYALSHDVYLYLALNYSALGKNETALSQLTKWKTISDSLFSEENANAINKLEIAFETEKKEKELMIEKVEKEKAEKEKFQMQLMVYKKNKWILAVSFFGALGVAFVLVLMQRNKRKTQREKDLAIIAEKERGLASIINAQEEERKRVAKDLHDGVGQQISAVSLNVQVLAKKLNSVAPELSSEMDRIKQLISETGADIRAVSHQMMPRALTEFGLVEAIQDIIDKNFVNTGINIRFDHHNMDERMVQNIEIGLYRIVQELLNNIIKHSEANQVELQLFKTASHVVLIVQDNGKGLGNTRSDGMGMLNMNSRINAMKGEFNLESESGAGTTATIKVKL